MVDAWPVPCVVLGDGVGCVVGLRAGDAVDATDGCITHGNRQYLLGWSQVGVLVDVRGAVEVMGQGVQEDEASCKVTAIICSAGARCGACGCARCGRGHWERSARG